MTLEESLSSLGLDSRETKLYLAALEMGETLILPLARHAGLKRATLYEILPKLHNLGLINYGQKGKRRTVIAQDPSKLVYIQEQKLQDIRAILPQLMSRFNSLESKPKVYSYEGIEGIKQVYEDTLVEEFPILSFLQVKTINPEIQSYLLKSYVPRRVKKGIRVKNIVSGESEQGERIVPDEGSYRENRYVDEKLFPANIEVLIYSNKVAFITYKTGSQPMGIIAENKDVAETMRSFHKMAWEFAGHQILSVSS